MMFFMGMLVNMIMLELELYRPFKTRNIIEEQDKYNNAIEFSHYDVSKMSDSDLRESDIKSFIFNNKNKE